MSLNNILMASKFEKKKRKERKRPTFQTNTYNVNFSKDGSNPVCRLYHKFDITEDIVSTSLSLMRKNKLLH